MANTCRTAAFSNVRSGPIRSAARPAAHARPLPLALAAGALLAFSSSALAFSQITREDGQLLRPDDIISAPLPPLDPDRSGAAPDWGLAPAGPDSPETFEELDEQDSEPLPIRYGEEGLPRPVRDLRARLMEIASTGEIEALRPYLETGANPTALSVVPVEGDPIDFLRQSSGDEDGVEILAILLEVLRAGHVVVDEGAPDEIYVWPYFAQMPLENLSRPQLVELFELVTAGDYQTMLDFGAYYFYRVGISPDGRLEFFLAGD